jgi:hypothetical protein
MKNAYFLKMFHHRLKFISRLISRQGQSIFLYFTVSSFQTVSVAKPASCAGGKGGVPSSQAKHQGREADHIRLVPRLRSVELPLSDKRLRGVVCN